MKRMSRPRVFSLLFFVVFLVDLTAFADIKLPALISDNMVLQSDVKTRIWGLADPGEKVTVTLQKQSISTLADDSGSWQVYLAPMKAGGPVEMTVAGRDRITVRNILIGEVWVVAGQSNIWWPVNRTTNAEIEIAQADYPRLRLLTVPIRVASKPLPDMEDKYQPVGQPEPEIQARWVQCSPYTISWFTGVGYYFGRQLQKNLDVPVGLIAMGVGGSVVNAWTSRTALENNPSCKYIVDYWDNYASVQYPQKKIEHEKELTEWEKAVKLAQDMNNPEPPRPNPPVNPDLYVNRNSVLYNGMVAPVTPYTIRGVAWYQGESDASGASRYQASLFTMIHDWRKAWDIGSFPFLIVQLPQLDTSQFISLGKDWATMRQAQARALELENTGLIVTIDIGEADNAHPPNKQDVGQRLSLAARALVYDQKIAYSGPMYKSMTIEGSKVRLTFDHVEDGLVARGGELTGFTIAGPDLKLVSAQAQIDGPTVVVWSDKVKKPVAVHYAWSDNPICNLYNQAGLPAGPFRTDDLSINP